MKKLIFIIIIFSLFSVFVANTKALTPLAPENELVINKTIRQCAIAKFNSELSRGWKEQNLCYDHNGCPKMVDYLGILGKNAAPIIKDICDNGYLYQKDAEPSVIRDTHFEETIDYSTTGTFLLATSKYAIMSVPLAVDTNTGSCNIGQHEVKGMDADFKIVLRIKPEAEDRTKKYFNSDDYQQKVYKSFCEAIGYKFIGNLGYHLYKNIIILGALAIGIVIIVGLIIFFRKGITKAG